MFQSDLTREFKQKDQTNKDQQETSRIIQEMYDKIYENEQELEAYSVLEKDEHYVFQLKHLINVSKFSQGLDTGHPWIIFWTLNSLHLLKEKEQESVLDEEQESELIRLLKQMKDKNGCFSGGQNQISHLASCYAAIMSISLIKKEKGYEIIEKEKIYKWLLSLKNKNRKGSFLMHKEGEVDLRAVYIVITIGSILNLLTEELIEGVGEYITDCQSYEGGIGSDINREAHGGYTYCGVAALAIINQLHLLNIHSLLNWLTSRQTQQSGFNGRTNKLVDSCYSFWQASIFNILQTHFHHLHFQNHLLYSQLDLQKYIILCCQNHQDAGMRDKPYKNADLYHTCYSLAGLSLSQQGNLDKEVYFNNKKQNKLNRLNPLFNIPDENLQKIKNYFKTI